MGDTLRVSFKGSIGVRLRVTKGDLSGYCYGGYLPQIIMVTPHIETLNRC